LKDVRCRAAVQLFGGRRSDAAALSAAGRQTSCAQSARAARAVATRNRTTAVFRASAGNAAINDGIRGGD